MAHMKWQPNPVMGSGCRVRVLDSPLGCATLEITAPSLGTLTFSVAGANLEALARELTALVDLPRVSRPAFAVAGPEDDRINEEAPVNPRLAAVAGTSSKTIPGQEKRTA